MKLEAKHVVTNRRTAQIVSVQAFGWTRATQPQRNGTIATAKKKWHREANIRIHCSVVLFPATEWWWWRTRNYTRLHFIHWAVLCTVKRCHVVKVHIMRIRRPLAIPFSQAIGRHNHRRSALCWALSKVHSLPADCPLAKATIFFFISSVRTWAVAGLVDCCASLSVRCKSYKPFGGDSHGHDKHTNVDGQRCNIYELSINLSESVFFARHFAFLCTMQAIWMYLHMEMHKITVQVDEEHSCPNERILSFYCVFKGILFSSFWINNDVSDVFPNLN